MMLTLIFAISNLEELNVNHNVLCSSRTLFSKLKYTDHSRHSSTALHFP
jgi:hypothetical protein